VRGENWKPFLQDKAKSVLPTKRLSSQCQRWMTVEKGRRDLEEKDGHRERVKKRENKSVKARNLGFRQVDKFAFGAKQKMGGGRGEARRNQKTLKQIAKSRNFRPPAKGNKLPKRGSDSRGGNEGSRDNRFVNPYCVQYKQ